MQRKTREKIKTILFELNPIELSLNFTPYFDQSAGKNETNEEDKLIEENLSNLQSEQDFINDSGSMQYNRYHLFTDSVIALDLPNMKLDRDLFNLYDSEDSINCEKLGEVIVKDSFSFFQQEEFIMKGPSSKIKKKECDLFNLYDLEENIISEEMKKFSN